MLSKISNTATKDEIEQNLNVKFDYGYLYKPKIAINGLKESMLSIITSDAPDRVQFGIWGILPKGYRDSWKSFQSIHNTLEIVCKSIPETSWLYEALMYRRCLIVATGFYTSEIKDHKIQSFLNISSNKKVFCFAGIYNILEDGFIACSILTQPNGSSHYHLKNPKPIILTEDKYQVFLNRNIPIADICNLNSVITYNTIERHEVVQSKQLTLKKDRND